MIRNDKERGRLVHKEWPTYKMLKRGDLVILVAKTGKISIPPKLDGSRKQQPPRTQGQHKNSPTSGTSIDGEGREIPTEKTASKTIKGTIHKARGAVKDNMNIETGGTYLELSGTKEKYTTHVTDHTFAWKDVWWELELSRDDPETIDVPVDTKTQNSDSEVGSISTGIIAFVKGVA